jgi:DNA-directed RNA polymerase subunit RPC12/RpoP
MTARFGLRRASMIQAVCGRCGGRFTVERAMAGKADRCPECGAGVLIPGGEAYRPFPDWDREYPANKPFLASPGGGSVRWRAYLGVDPVRATLRIGKAALDAYARALAAEVTDRLPDQAGGRGSDLILTADLTPWAGPNLVVYMLPGHVLDGCLLDGLFERLFAVPTPAVRGEVGFRLHFEVGVGSGRFAEVFG